MKISVQEVMKNTDLSQNKSLNEIIYKSLRTTLIQGKIPVGERINEQEYAEALKISRTPIRCALRKLEQEGLVEYIPKMGVVVKQVTPKDAIEIYEIRKSLEVLTFIKAMKRMTKEDFEELDELLTLTEKKNLEGNIQHVIQLFITFHHFIYEKSDMHRVREMMTKIHEYLSRFREVSLTTESRRDKAIREHRHIYQAMVEQDEVKVKRLIEDHLNYSLIFILKEMEKEQLAAMEKTKKERTNKWLGEN